MTALRGPVKNALRATTTEASVARMWNRIEARGRTQPRRSVGPAWRLAAATLLLASVALGVVPPMIAHLARRAERPKTLVITPAGSSHGAGAAGEGAPAPTHAPVPARSASAPAPLPSHLAPPASRAGAAQTSAGASASPAPTSSKRWRQLAAQGDNVSAYADLGPSGIASESKSASIEDLFTLADVARLSGHPAEAVAPLDRILADFGADARAPLAALTLGRVQLESLGNPAAAAAALQRAIVLGVPAGLAEDAYALRIEARSKAGDADGARAAYADFVARFPDSARTAELRKWVHDP